ncbi:MAG TPA: DUF4251 domain-containing protein, partial [Prevotella sp.]
MHIGASHTPAKAAQQALTAQRVEETLASGHYSVDVRYMYSLRGIMKPVDYGYGISVQGDTLQSYLPYYGVVHGRVPYGGGKGLNFKGILTDYTLTS